MIREQIASATEYAYKATGKISAIKSCFKLKHESEWAETFTNIVQLARSVSNLIKTNHIAAYTKSNFSLIQFESIRGKLDTNKIFKKN